MNYSAYTPASDTHELRADLRGPYWETQTVEVHLLDLQPAVTPTRHYTWHARLRLLWLRVMASYFMRDVRAYASYAFWPFAIAVGLFVGFYLRDQIVTWHGLVNVYGGAR